MAFYYNGNAFVKIDYKVAAEREAAVAQINAVDMSLYYAEEQTLVNNLISETKEKIGQCFNSSDLRNVLNAFDVELKEIKTIEDYAILSAQKAEVKVALNDYFNALDESEYGAKEWELICSIQVEAGVLIDAADSMKKVSEVVGGIEYKVEEILTEAEKPAFAEFVAAAIKNVKDAFVASLYREAEVERANWLIGNAEKALDQATTYGEAEALELAYLAEIKALKTAAEWEAEEAANKQEEPEVEQPQPEEPADDETSENNQGGCGSSVVENLVVISMALAATLVVIMKKRKI